MALLYVSVSSSVKAGPVGGWPLTVQAVVGVFGVLSAEMKVATFLIPNTSRLDVWSQLSLYSFRHARCTLLTIRRREAPVFNVPCDATSAASVSHGLNEGPSVTWRNKPRQGVPRGARGHLGQEIMSCMK